MARGRMIDKVIILSKKVNAISEQAENLYYRLNVCADDFGHHHADPEIIKGQVYTKRKISLTAIQKRLDELWNIGLIELYAVNGETYLEIIGFADHQVFRKDIPKKSVYPSPKGFLQKSRNESVTGCNESDTERGLKLSKDKLSKDQDKIYAPTDKNRSEPTSTTKIKISFDFEKGEFLNITEEQKKKWALAFPAVDIEGFIKRMEIWQAANPGKRKTNYERAFSNWLSKEQDRGGTGGSPSPPKERRWLKETKLEDG